MPLRRDGAEVLFGAAASLPGHLLNEFDAPIMVATHDLAIATRGLRKVFDDKVAVRNLNLQVQRGEIFGFLGQNGAGKSTVVKMLLGLVRPTAGEATILGRPARDVNARRKIGFLPEQFRFYEWLTAAELLRLHGRLYGMSDALLQERVPALLDLVGLTPHNNKQLRDFSKGMQQRIGLAQALLNDPELIFLDEPTSGLDPLGRRLVRDIIRAQRERGATVFLNSHLLSEVEITCDRVAFIRHGEVVETQEIASLLQEQTRVSIRVGKTNGELLAGLQQWTSSAHMEGDRLRLSVSCVDALPDIIRYLVTRGADVYEVTRERLSLEDRFLEIVGPDGGL